MIVKTSISWIWMPVIKHIIKNKLHIAGDYDTRVLLNGNPDSIIICRTSVYIFGHNILGKIVSVFYKVMFADISIDDFNEFIFAVSMGIAD